MIDALQQQSTWVCWGGLEGHCNTSLPPTWNPLEGIHKNGEVAWRGLMNRVLGLPIKATHRVWVSSTGTDQVNLYPQPPAAPISLNFTRAICPV
eukprot:scaffold252206_cov19-Prasinocladus_malaysianus.AAC.1